MRVEAQEAAGAAKPSNGSAHAAPASDHEHASGSNGTASESAGGRSTDDGASAPADGSDLRASELPRPSLLRVPAPGGHGPSSSAGGERPDRAGGRQGEAARQAAVRQMGERAQEEGLPAPPSDRSRVAREAVERAVRDVSLESGEEGE